MSSNKVTINNNKQEIYDAYKELLTKFNADRGNDVDPVKQLNAKKTGEALDKAAEIAGLSVEEQIAHLQKNVNTVLANLANSFTEEVGNFKSVQEAIVIKQNELKELFGIEVELFSFADVVNTNKEISNQLKAEIAQLREQIRDERDQAMQDLRELRESDRQEREREEEEYEYSFDRTKQIEKDNLSDELAAKRKQFNAEIDAENENIQQQYKELREKEEALAKREQYMTELETKVAAFPTQIEEVKKSIEEAVRKDEARTTAIKENAIKREYDSKLAISDNKITLLQDSLASKNKENEELARKLDAAYDKIQGMALASVNGQKESEMFGKFEKMMTEKGSQK